jgi:hypothetical protein
MKKLCALVTLIFVLSLAGESLVKTTTGVVTGEAKTRRIVIQTGTTTGGRTARAITRVVRVAIIAVPAGEPVSTGETMVTATTTGRVITATTTGSN